MALYSGILIEADAVSRSLQNKLDFFSRLAADGVPIQTAVFTHASDSHNAAVHQVQRMEELIRSVEFQEADVHIFEFGIRYDLFNAIFLIPEDQVRLGVFHNVTPPDLADTPEQRDVLCSSLCQANNLFLADRVLCVSEFSRDGLSAQGFAPDRLSVLHLPPAIASRRRALRDTDDVEILFVGRLVRAKGVFDLIDAVRRLTERGETGVRLTLAGNVAFSSPDSIDALMSMLQEEPLRSIASLVRSPSDDELAALYARADVLVIPSYHEGYCLPVIEGLNAGCQVIAYDAGNLANVVDRVGTLVPCGDVDALSQAISAVLRPLRAAPSADESPQVSVAGTLVARAEWRAAVTAHLAAYSRNGYERGLVEITRWAAEQRGRTDVLDDLAGSRAVRDVLTGAAG